MEQVCLPRYEVKVSQNKKTRKQMVLLLMTVCSASCFNFPINDRDFVMYIYVITIIDN